MKSGYWLPALVCAVCQVFGIGLLGVYGFFVEPLSTEFGVGVAAINIGPVFLFLAPAFVGPAIGRFVDSSSIRAIMLIGVAISVVSLFGISLAGSLILAGSGFFAYAIGQALYGPVVLNALLIKVYQSNVARALAIGAMGVSVGSVTLPYLVAWLMDNYAWRQTLSALALIVGVVLMLSIRLGLERDPGARRVIEDRPDIEVGRAYLRHPAFWIIGVSIAVVFNMALMGAVCYAPHFGQLGFSNTSIATFLAAGGAGGFTAKLLVASFVDRWRRHLKWIAVMVVAVDILGFTALLLGESFTVIIIATALMGASGGAFLPLHPFLNSRYFSASSMGKVNGAQAPLMLPLGLISAPLAGYVFDTTQSYQWAFMAAIVLLAAAALLLLTLPRASE